MDYPKDIFCLVLDFHMYIYIYIYLYIYVFVCCPNSACNKNKFSGRPFLFCDSKGVVALQVQLCGLATLDLCSIQPVAV